jgi:hypothetical protein
LDGRHEVAQQHGDLATQHQDLHVLRCIGSSEQDRFDRFDVEIVWVSHLLGLAQLAQVGGEVVSRGEGVGVIVAQHAAEPGEGVVLELAGLLVLAQQSQGDAEVGGCA